MAPPQSAELKINFTEYSVWHPEIQKKNNSYFQLFAQKKKLGTKYTTVIVKKHKLILINI